MIDEESAQITESTIFNHQHQEIAYHRTKHQLRNRTKLVACDACEFEPLGMSVQAPIKLTTFEINDAPGPNFLPVIVINNRLINKTF